MKTNTTTFESALKKLEDTVEKLEEGTIPLNEALTTFESGVHWSRECKKFLDNAGKSKLDIVNEIDRYINWPGQALAYKVGQLKIFELRDKAKKELGENFDIRLFHTALLSEGAIPLNELEIVIDAYIESNK